MSLQPPNSKPVPYPPLQRTNGVIVELGSVLVGTEPRVNFIQGSNVTLTVADNPSLQQIDVTIASSGGSVTTANLLGTSNQISLSASGTGVIVGSTNITLSVPTNAQLSIAKLTNLTTNGFIKTSSSDGTLTIDTNTYLTSVTAHNILSATHGDTLVGTVVAGDIIIGNATPKWSRLAKGTDGQVLTLVSGLPAWVSGGGGSPGGSTNDLQWNNSGAFGGGELQMATENLPSIAPTISGYFIGLIGSDATVGYGIYPGGDYPCYTVWDGNAYFGAKGSVVHFGYDHFFYRDDETTLLFRINSAGITTDGTNFWSFAGPTTAAAVLKTTQYLNITINSIAYKLALIT